MPSRRDLLTRSAAVAALLGGAGLLPGTVQAAWNRAAFDARSVAEVLNALGLARPVDSGAVTLTAPDVAENGVAVAVAVSTTLPGVTRLALLVEKNPTTLAAVFDCTEFVEPAIATRIKMGESSTVLAVAVTADGRVWFAQKRVQVILGGCGD